MLELFAEKLSTLPEVGVDLAIAEIAIECRGQYEPAIPELGAIYSRALDHGHELKHLRGIIRKLAANFGVQVDERMLERYQAAAGHRTDEDLDKACEHFLRYYNDREMPTTGQFREACGIPRFYRDGRRA